MWNRAISVLIMAFAVFTIAGFYKFEYSVVVVSATIAFAVGYFLAMFRPKPKAMLVVIAVFFISYFTIAQYIDIVNRLMLVFWSSLLAHKFWTAKT